LKPPISDNNTNMAYFFCSYDPPPVTDWDTPYDYCFPPCNQPPFPTCPPKMAEFGHLSSRIH
jgi:hypothetical protein